MYGNVYVSQPPAGWSQAPQVLTYAPPVRRRNHVWERIYVPASGWVVASSPGMNLRSACSASQPCMGRFLAYSLCTSYEAKYFKMNKKNNSENYFRFWKSYEVIMKQKFRERSGILCVILEDATECP